MSLELSESDGAVVIAGQVAALGILECARDAGEAGLPSGNLYVSLASKGCSLQRYELILRSLENTGMIRRVSECIFITQPGLAAIERLKKEIARQKQ